MKTLTLIVCGTEAVGVKVGLIVDSINLNSLTVCHVMDLWQLVSLANMANL